MLGSRLDTDEETQDIKSCPTGSLLSKQRKAHLHEASSLAGC